MEIVLMGAQVQIGTAPNGHKVLQFRDRQSGIVVTVPIDPEAARTIGAALSSSVYVAQGPLPQATKVS